MSKTRDARSHAQWKKGRDDSNQRGSDSTEPINWPQPLRPRRVLAILLALVLIALFAGLIVLYFKTVYPNRSQPQPIERDAPAGIKAST